MKIDITGRHIEVTEPIRKFATDRIEKLRGIADEVIEAHLILTVEKHQRHLAEINIKTQHDFHHAEEESTDMYTSIAAVLDKIEKQFRRSKGKTEAARHPRNNGFGIVASSALEAEEAIGDKLPRIIRTHEVTAKPQTVDDAAGEVDATADGFLVFRNSETLRLNVVYKRRDGNIGWIEPEA